MKLVLFLLPMGFIVVLLRIFRGFEAHTCSTLSVPPKGEWKA